MNIAHPTSTYILFSLAVGILLSGCHGMQGVRYHDGDLDKLAGDDAAAMHDAGFELGMGQAAGDGSVPAPHPRFHPLPTRPVFEPDGLAVAAVPASELSEPAAAPVNETAETRSVLAAPEKPKVELASATSKSLLQEMLPAQNPSVEKSRAYDNDTESSRRKTESDAVSKAAAEIDDAPPAFAPAETTAPSLNDGWHPRVASP